MALKLVYDVSAKLFDTEYNGAFPKYIYEIHDILGIYPESPESFLQGLPFSLDDTTAGVENELQTVVIGRKEDVDLPASIENSGFYRNLLKRASAGEMPQRVLSDLRSFLNDNSGNVWENSWVGFPASCLNRYAKSVFNTDLLADKKNPTGPKRNDSDKFAFMKNGKEFVRIPVSYLLKLALADVIGSEAVPHPAIRETGEKMLEHFLNDNTSPEIFSFYPMPLNRNRSSRNVAKETLKRFLLVQCLTQYANRKFDLLSSGQQASVYFAPHPHTRQKKLNDLISDSFYRELFMSPCLSGWDKGEAKFSYMNLCHLVLSRSQMNAVVKLKEAGIISRNLVVLPNMSNISLANNGTHISLGSRKLSNMLGDPQSGFEVRHEKYLGDLAIKIVEHFLPLFVGTYSAAPYRLDYWYFHPEKALGFLPHELDFTHLRMMWRRWKKKAKLKVFGQPITPFGPEWLDRRISRIFGLNGDFVQDFRLIDYPVSLLSTSESPALDGSCGSDKRLKQDLADMGVFDTAMPLYLLYRMREFAAKGFSGFEARYYSLFEHIGEDMSHAVSLQTLITALAYKYILKGELTHFHIPDDPVIESERRQVFFGTAIGIPTFYVHRSSKNVLMMKILSKVKKTRLSRRYKGYIRVHNLEYRRALIEILREDAADLIEMMRMEETIKDLNERIENPSFSAAGKLTRGILNHAGAKSALSLSGDEFNQAAEQYYRDTLRKRHIREALLAVTEDFGDLDAYSILDRYDCKAAMYSILKHNSGASHFLEKMIPDILEETLSADGLSTLIRLIVLSVYQDMQRLKGDSEL